ncbi:Uncharacterized membrane protein [Lachnospiraceae bacterium KH1T2]|nr:Uncharacterized membrane protein [Lachnospiraceae bacterium KH1T2]
MKRNCNNGNAVNSEVFIHENGEKAAPWTRIRIIALLACFFFFTITYFFIHNVLIQKDNSKSTSVYVRGKVVDLIQDNTSVDHSTENVLRGDQDVIVQILSGAHKGEQYETVNYMSALYNINCQEGTGVIVRLDPIEAGGYSAYIYSYDRSAVIAFCLLFFALCLIVIGRRKGLMALIALIVTMVSIWGILFPLLEYDFPVMAVSIAIVFYVIILTFILLEGISTKTVSAALGTLAGVVIAGVFAAIAGHFAHVSGFQTTEAEELLIIGRDHGMKIRYLFTAGILIAALGAVMDVAMSIASSVHELHSVNQELTQKELFNSGMNIGRDAMGTMANTLILALAGSSFTLLLLIYFYNITWTQLLSTDLVAREVIQGISGSIGIILTVPIVAFLSATIEIHYHHKLLQH